FGYRAGAFTGAEQASAGRAGRAEGGTLVLDHVEELPLATQPKLLRLVAERRYAPLGGVERTADLRFLAIGSEDLPVRVARETFRPDLFYRLEVLAFLLPPLRERRRDLPAILDHLLADLAVRFGRPGLELAPGARAWMLDHSWPGNLRQLRNVLERGLILAGLAGDAPIDPPPPEGTPEGRPRPLLEVEKEMIRNALAYTRGHQGQAAGLLGISRKALWEKRKRYGIP
ncbi:MAG TPA: sigma 54-interacting transcriptional regulator, partial [Thermoanaerobaculia bacterium]